MMYTSALNRSNYLFSSKYRGLTVKLAQSYILNIEGPIRVLCLNVYHNTFFFVYREVLT